MGLDACPGDWFGWAGTGTDRRLTWNIAGLAHLRGLTAPQLAFQASMYHRMIQLYWQGTAQSVFLHTLDKLAGALTTEEHPFDRGDLFTWASEPPG